MQTTSEHSIKSTPILIHCFFKINLNTSFLNIILILPSNYLYAYPLTKLLCVLLISPEPDTYLSSESFHLTTPTILTEQCELQNSSLCVSILMLFLSLRFRYTPQYSILRHHQSTFNPYGERPIFTPSQNDSYQSPFASSQMAKKHVFWWGVTYIYIYIMMKRRHFLSADRFYSAVEKRVEERESYRRRWDIVLFYHAGAKVQAVSSKITFNFFEIYSPLKSRWTVCIRRIREMKITERKCQGLTETPKGQDIVLLIYKITNEFHWRLARRKRLLNIRLEVSHRWKFCVG
jgi:hypothetical protein